MKTLDLILVGIVVLAACGLIVWRLRPRAPRVRLDRRLRRRLFRPGRHRKRRPGTDKP